jgi:hypothetical protein
VLACGSAKANELQQERDYGRRSASQRGELQDTTCGAGGREELTGSDRNNAALSYAVFDGFFSFVGYEESISTFFPSVLVKSLVTLANCLGGRVINAHRKLVR